MQQKETDDDRRTVTVTIANLKAFETAVRARQDARLVVARAHDAFEAAKTNLEQACKTESYLQDVEAQATAALHGRDQ